VYITRSRLDIAVILMSKILPAMMPRSWSMSKTFESTVRRDPNSRVENQTNPIAL
jgi:hypothetical protein